MTSKERLLRALTHSEPDRVPIDLAGTPVTSICKGAYESFRKYLDLPEEEIVIIDQMQQLPAVGEDLLTKVRSDTRCIPGHPPSNWKLEIKEEGRYLIYYDEWNIKLRMPKQGGLYYDFVGFPLADARIEDLATYRWPNAKDKDRFVDPGRRARKLHDRGEYAIGVPAPLGAGFFEESWWLRGMPNIMMDMVNNPEFLETLLENLLQIYMEAWDGLLNVAGEYADFVQIGDDLCAQNGPLMSPRLYRKFIKPRARKLIEFIRKRTKAPVFFHCCGSVAPLLPDLIEIGVDILNPVQVSAAGMNTKELKKDFGKDIVFWGGCDTQHILPYGTPEMVREEVKRIIDDLAPGGGFVFSTVHNIQNDVPPENLWAMYETVWEYGRY